MGKLLRSSSLLHLSTPTFARTRVESRPWPVMNDFGQFGGSDEEFANVRKFQAEVVRLILAARSAYLTYVPELTRRAPNLRSPSLITLRAGRTSSSPARPSRGGSAATRAPRPLLPSAMPTIDSSPNFLSSLATGKSTPSWSSTLLAPSRLKWWAPRSRGGASVR